MLVNCQSNPVLAGGAAASSSLLMDKVTSFVIELYKILSSFVAQSSSLLQHQILSSCCSNCRILEVIRFHNSVYSHCVFSFFCCLNCRSAPVYEFAIRLGGGIRALVCAAVELRTCTLFDTRQQVACGQLAAATIVGKSIRVDSRELCVAKVGTQPTIRACSVGCRRHDQQKQTTWRALCTASDRTNGIPRLGGQRRMR